MKKFVFNFLSLIFHPIFMPLYGILLITNLNEHVSIMTIELKKILLINTLIFTVLIPLFIYFLLYFIEFTKILKFDLITRRKILILLSFFSFYTAYVLINKIGISRIYPIFILSVAYSSLIIYLVNNFIKISFHACGISGILALLLFLAIKLKIDTLAFIVMNIFIISLLFISRVGLKAHTTGEYIAGVIIGFLSVFIFMNIIS